MAKRINVVLSADVHSKFVRQVARGRRSGVLEEVLRQYLGRQRRSAAARKLRTLREHAPVVSMRAVVDQLRRDRGQA
jgi:hypothetical protein